MYEVRQFIRRTVPATETYFGAAFAPTIIQPTMLLHFDGPNGSNFMYDSSGHFVITNSGGVTIDTSQSVFGGTSAFFSGTVGTSLLSIQGDNGLLSFGTNDFTVDFWFQHQNIGVLHALMTFNTTGTVVLSVNVDDTLAYYVGGGIVIQGPTIPINTWFHVALTRRFTQTKLFLNGGQVGSTYLDQNNYSTNGFGPPIIGADPGGGTNLLGWMDEIRIINGTAMWTGDFQVPTSAYKPPG